MCQRIYRSFKSSVHTQVGSNRCRDRAESYGDGSDVVNHRGRVCITETKSRIGRARCTLASDKRKRFVPMVCYVMVKKSAGQKRFWLIGNTDERRCIETRKMYRVERRNLAKHADELLEYEWSTEDMGRKS